MSPSAMRIVTAEVTNGLQQLRDEKTRLETMLVTIASDPGRRARLHHVAESIRGRLESTAAHVPASRRAAFDRGLAAGTRAG